MKGAYDDVRSPGIGIHPSVVWFVGLKTQGITIQFPTHPTRPPDITLSNENAIVRDKDKIVIYLKMQGYFVKHPDGKKGKENNFLFIG